MNAAVLDAISNLRTSGLSAGEKILSWFVNGGRGFLALLELWRTMTICIYTGDADI